MTPNDTLSGNGNRLRIVIAGGGTGGHLYPGLAIADEIRRRQPEAQILFVGTKGRIEERVVPASGYALETIWISGLRRTFSLATLLMPLKVAVAVAQSFRILKRMRPHVVVGTGGYVCGPVLWAALQLRMRTLIQEQNSEPGVTTHFLASRVDEVHITFPETAPRLPRQDNIRISGNPVRASLALPSREEAARAFGFNADRPTLLVFGGSQGSVAINSVMLTILPAVLETGAQILWQTGLRDAHRVITDPAVKAAYDSGTLNALPYIERMDLAYAACDVVLCRAGATTLAELTLLGKPSVLIPLPSAAADHQTSNARSLADRHAAILVRESAARSELLPALRRLLADRTERQLIGENAASLGRPKAAATLANAVLTLARAM